MNDIGLTIGVRSEDSRELKLRT